MRRTFLATCLLAAVWAAPLAARAIEKAQEVSLVALLAQPQAYDGKRVSVEGFFDGSNFETCQLYLTKSDFDFYVVRNAIYVRWPGCNDQGGAKAQRRYARIDGVFQSDMGSEFGSFSAIRNVRTVEPLESRTQFRKRIHAAPALVYRPWLILGLPIIAMTTFAAYWIARRLYR